MYQRILLPIDGSSTSLQALQEVRRIARPGATVRVVTVVEDPVVSFPTVYGGYSEIEAIRSALLEEGKQMLASAQRELQDHGITAQTKLLDLRELGGDIPGAIKSASDAWQADVIVLGTHGRRGARRLFLGSVAEHLVRIADCPVLLVRSDESKSVAQPT
ncbi:MAG: universal stress protein [Burkholderiales bacterium]|nr:universal stress protein [Burkholderiales bacterium]